MGLFSWLFGKKKTNCEDSGDPQRHFCEEKPKKTRKKSTKKVSEETPNE